MTTIESQNIAEHNHLNEGSAKIHGNPLVNDKVSSTTIRPPTSPTRSYPPHVSLRHHPVNFPPSPSSPHRVPMATAFPTGVGGPPRSLSLSPTHLMGRHRGIGSATASTSPSLLVPGPNMPFMSQPSSETPVRFSEHQRAMEQAVAAERQRAKEMEEKEKDLSADELRQILKQERHRMAGFARTIADLRSTAVQCQSQAEIHEEGRINSLLGRLETMQLEKGRIVNELEREEEMLTNTLQKKLDQVKREKTQLERLIEHEQRSHSNLQSKLTGLKESSGAGNSETTAAMATGRNMADNNVSAVEVPSSHVTTTKFPAPSLGALSESMEEGDDEEEDENLDEVLADLAALDKEG